MDALCERLAPYAHLVVQARAKSDGRPRLYVGRGQGRRGRYETGLSVTYSASDPASEREAWRGLVTALKP